MQFVTLGETSSPARSPSFRRRDDSRQLLGFDRSQHAVKLVSKRYFGEAACLAVAAHPQFEALLTTMNRFMQQCVARHLAVGRPRAEGSGGRTRSCASFDLFHAAGAQSRTNSDRRSPLPRDMRGMEDMLRKCGRLRDAERRSRNPVPGPSPARTSLSLRAFSLSVETVARSELEDPPTKNETPADNSDSKGAGR